MSCAEVKLIVDHEQGSQRDLAEGVGCVRALLAPLVLEGIVKPYCAELDFQREARPFLLTALFSPQPRGRAPAAA